jgi:hypothetical protein
VLLQNGELARRYWISTYHIKPTALAVVYLGHGYVASDAFNQTATRKATIYDDTIKALRWFHHGVEKFGKDNDATSATTNEPIDRIYYYMAQLYNQLNDHYNAQYWYNRIFSVANASSSSSNDAKNNDNLHTQLTVNVGYVRDQYQPACKHIVIAEPLRSLEADTATPCACQQPVYIRSLSQLINSAASSSSIAIPSSSSSLLSLADWLNYRRVLSRRFGGAITVDEVIQIALQLAVALNDCYDSNLVVHSMEDFSAYTYVYVPT